MEIIRGRSFTAEHAWGSKLIANMQGITTKIHWTNRPYQWHINEGEEVFVVLDGAVHMHYKDRTEHKVAILESGDIFFASVGTEHVAHPQGEARILVIESEGSV